jgi:hypothetical protein
MHNSGNISFDAGRPAHRCKLTAEINSNLQFFLLMRFTTTLMITSILRIFPSEATCAFFAQVESGEQAGSDNRLSPPGDGVCPDMPIYLISGQIITSAFIRVHLCPSAVTIIALLSADRWQL